jgi:hypothetical protein
MHQRSSLVSASHGSERARTRWPLAVSALCALTCFSGCSDEPLNLGGDEQASLAGSTCDVDLESFNNFYALNQADVVALRGCRELPGDLYIRIPESEQATFTLAPLAELEVVHGVLSIAGPLTSLAGLEALEQVGSLQLESLLVSDLIPLRGLRRVQGGLSDAGVFGSVSIQACDELTDLSGLASLTDWRSLFLGNLDALVTLAGLQAPPRLDQLMIMGAPRLSDISALAGVEDLNHLVLSNTAVARFEHFELEVAELIELASNPALTDLDGLDELEIVGNLMIRENPALERVELPELASYEGISITGNAVLQAVPPYLAERGSAMISPSGDLEPLGIRSGRVLFEVGDNPQVKTIALPGYFGDLQQVAIYQNPSLISLDMTYLSRADNIWIQDNTVLASVAAPALERVDDLAIRNNPALSVAPFANVQTFARDVTGNLDELAP